MAWADEAERAFEAEYSGPGMAQGDAGPDLSVGMTGVGHPGQALGHEVSQVAGVEPPASIAADLQWGGDFGASNSWEGLSNDIGALDRMVREMQASDALTARENLNRDTSNVTQTDSMLGYDKAMRQGWAGEGQEDNSAFWGSGSEEPDMDSQQAFAEAEAEYSQSFAGVGSDVEQFLSSANRVNVPGRPRETVSALDAGQDDTLGERDIGRPSSDFQIRGMIEDASRVGRSRQRADAGYPARGEFDYWPRDVTSFQSDSPYRFTGVPGGGQEVPGQIDLGLPADFQAALDEQARTGFAPIQPVKTSGMDAPFWGSSSGALMEPNPQDVAAAIASSDGTTQTVAPTQAAPTVAPPVYEKHMVAGEEDYLKEQALKAKIAGLTKFLPGGFLLDKLPKSNLSRREKWIAGGQHGFYKDWQGEGPRERYDWVTEGRKNVGWITNPFTGKKVPYGPPVPLDRTDPIWLQHGSTGDAGELGWFYKKYPWATGLSSQIVQRAVQDGEFLRELIRAAEADELWLYT